MAIKKEDLIKYFQDGCKNENNLSIGVEHEKFLFNNKLNDRVNFKTIIKVFKFLEKFGWKPIKENGDIVALHKNNKKITLEPGNQLELSGALKLALSPYSFLLMNGGPSGCALTN